MSFQEIHNAKKPSSEWFNTLADCVLCAGLFGLPLFFCFFVF